MCIRDSFTTSSENSEGSFNWEITEANVRAIPYQIVIKARDSRGAATFKILQISITDAVTSTLESFRSLGYQLYPNPTIGDTYLQIPDDQFNASSEITIFDNLGRQVRQYQFETMGETISLETANLDPGIYLIQIHTDLHSISTQLVIQQ